MRAAGMGVGVGGGVGVGVGVAVGVGVNVAVGVGVGPKSGRFVAVEQASALAINRIKIKIMGRFMG